MHFMSLFYQTGEILNLGLKTAQSQLPEFQKFRNELLNEYEKPPIDPAIQKELEAYIKKRKEQILT